VIDLRSLDEAPVSPFESALRIEVEALERAPLDFPGEARVVLCCRSGLRAWRAASSLRSRGHEKLALIALGE
jgi:rhodanese-related sulfurtransferase